MTASVNARFIAAVESLSPSRSAVDHFSGQICGRRPTDPPSRAQHIGSGWARNASGLGRSAASPPSLSSPSLLRILRLRFGNQDDSLSRRQKKPLTLTRALNMIDTKKPFNTDRSWYANNEVVFITLRSSYPIHCGLRPSKQTHLVESVWLACRPPLTLIPHCPFHIKTLLCLHPSLRCMHTVHPHQQNPSALSR